MSICFFMVLHKTSANFSVTCIGAVWPYVGSVAVIFQIYCVRIWGMKNILVMGLIRNSMIFNYF